MNKKIIFNAISAVLAMGLASATDAASSMGGDIKGMEKCYGIAKAGMNDCGNKSAGSSHNCAGEAKLDGEKDAWIFVPTGLCNKIVGGSTKAS